jgi:hypothetical protein
VTGASGAVVETRTIGAGERLAAYMQSVEVAGGCRAFHYQLFDIAGREVDVVERVEPLRAHETIALDSAEEWRVISVLGKSATVARA